MNKLILKTLKPLEIPVNFQIYNGCEPQYITFFTYVDKGELYGDDKEFATGYYIQLDVFSKGDYTELVKNVNKLMKEAGFLRKPPGPELYEEDFKLYHKPLRFFFCEENNNEEEI